MKINQIVYLTQTPFSKRDNDRFGVNIFLNHGVEVIILDITAYLDKYVAKNYVSDSIINYPYVKKFNNYSKIKKFILDTSSNTIFVSFIGESNVKSLKILSLLSQHKKEFGMILSGSLPTVTNKQNLSSRLKLLSLKNIKRLVIKAIYMLVSNDFNYSFIIASGKESYKIIQKKYKNSNIIGGHAFDYDLYLNDREEITIKDKEYAIFLDEFFPFHPDYIRHGIDYSAYADEYYKKLSNFFDYIENSFNVEVIISAHPRSYYEKLPNYWNNRKFIKGDTINLVKSSKICLLHASTSINFAILHSKPMIFLTMNEIKKSNVQNLLESMVSELKATLIDLDSFNRNKKININFDQHKYEDYKLQYIKSYDSPDLNNWELLYNYFLDKRDKK